MTPITNKKVYWSICVPKLFYGLEVVNLDVKQFALLELFHSSMAKQEQGLPEHSSNTGSLATYRKEGHCSTL